MHQLDKIKRLGSIKMHGATVKKKRNAEDADWRIILRWIFRNWEEVETGWSWLRIGTGGGYL